MISHEHRCIFIHVPKCAGTSIEDAVWPGPRDESMLWMGLVTPLRNRYQTGGLQHLTARLIRDVVGTDTFDDYYRFAVVRNPWDRAISQYVSLQRRPDLREYLGMEPDASFKTYLELIPRQTHVRWEPQYRFVDDDDGTPLVDTLLRFESLQRDIVPVFERLGISQTLPHNHASQRESPEAYYDDEAREMVANIYERDITRFGYSYPF